MTGVGVAATVAALCLALGASAASDRHERFVPLIAFKCGFRNRYMAENGTWVTDENKYATCLEGNLDKLKYCKKVYPSLNVTNIVEYSHEVTLAEWCREEGDKCTATKTVRPYRCIVGEFHSEALQVPHDCRFNHENSRDMCNDYDSWKKEATRLCNQRKDDGGKAMIVRSFAMLEPCGLDLFTGVEYVCCPTDDADAALISKKDEEKKDKTEDDDDEDDDDDTSSEYDGEKYDDDKSKESSRDVYFVSPFKDLASEHEKYREALDRMEQKHRVKVDKVMKEWNELDERYNKQKTIDPVKAELLKKEMSNRFQTTVAALEEEHRKMRKEIEEVHEERVQSSMNEKKRTATHEYRAALADAVAIPDKHKVLKTLKAYIRAEEKDRIHTLNRFRHLLREDTQEAMNIKAMTVHRLRYIDLRINGTVAMLKDLPTIDLAIRPIAMAFWSDFRRENTPEMTAETWKKIEDSVDKDQALVDFYEQGYRKVHPESFVKVKIPTYTKEAPLAHSDKQPTTAVPATIEPAKVLPKDDETDSEEDDDSYYEDDNDEEMKKTKKTDKKSEIKKETIKVVKEDIVHPPIVAVDEDADDSDDDDDDDEEDEKDSRKELRVDIEPIIDEHSRESIHVLPYSERIASRTHASWPFTSSGYVFFFIAAAFVGFSCFALVGLNRRRRSIRFVEVDVCSPEERHVNGMQINGYENPTYSFFDSKA